MEASADDTLHARHHSLRGCQSCELFIHSVIQKSQFNGSFHYYRLSPFKETFTKSDQNSGYCKTARYLHLHYAIVKVSEWSIRGKGR